MFVLLLFESCEGLLLSWLFESCGLWLLEMWNRLLYIALVVMVFEFHGLYCFCAGVYCFCAAGAWISWLYCFCTGVYCLNLVGYGYDKCEIGVYNKNPFYSSANENREDIWSEPNKIEPQNRTKPNRNISVRFWNSIFILFKFLRIDWFQLEKCPPLLLRHVLLQFREMSQKKKKLMHVGIDNAVSVIGKIKAG